jgi:CubicO group peptidase (beta-lactamase class C family)
MATASDKPANEEKMLALFKNKQLDFEPGSRFNYSNSGYSLLGYIIEKVSGKKYEQVMREFIFQPLQMTHSGFNFTNLDSPEKAVGYYSLTADNIKKAKIVDSSVSFSAGSIYSTTGDIYKWNQSLSTEKVLRKSSLKNAFTPRLGHYGFGVAVDTLYGKQFINHSGGIDGFVSFNAIMPFEKMSITVLSNVSTSQTGKLARDMVAILCNQPYNLPQALAARKDMNVDSSILKLYIGEYEISPAFHITVRVVNGSLKAEATGQQEFTLFAERENFFFLKVVRAEVEFIKGADGKIEKLILYQNGLQLTGKKIR